MDILSVDEKTTESYKPPYGAQKAFVDFFGLLQKRRIDKVDAAFLKANGIAPGNEKKVIIGLKFLGLIKDDGTSTEKMQSLNVQGEPFQRALATIVKDAYNVLFKTFNDVQTVSIIDLNNCFRVDYNMAPQLADKATNIFVYLAKTAGIQLSPSIMVEEPSPQPVIKGIKKKPESKPKATIITDESNQQPQVNTNSEYMPIPKGMRRLEIQNKVLIFLPETCDKGIKAQASKFAKQLIDIYEEDDTQLSV